MNECSMDEALSLFVRTVSACSNESTNLLSEQSCPRSSSAASDQTSSSPGSSNTSHTSSRGRVNRRHSFPLLRGNRTVDSRRRLSKSPSDFLSDHRWENETDSGIARSVSKSSNDSGCNCFGSENSPDLNGDRLGTETTPTGTQLARDDISANDSGYHHTVLQPGISDDFSTVSVRGSNPESKLTGTDDLKNGPDEVHGDKPAALYEISRSPLSAAVQRRNSSAAKFQRNCAADGDSGGKVVSRKHRRTSMTVRSPQQNRVARTRRRHSFMLPNGSDVYPSRFSGASFAWPTIVEEGLQLSSNAKSDATSAERLPNKRGGAVAEKDDFFADLMSFRTSLKSQQQSPSADSAKFRAATSSGAGESGSFQVNRGMSSPDFRELGTKLRSGLQLADAQRGQTTSGSFPQDGGALISGACEEGTLADLRALAAELGRATSASGETSSPSLTITRNLPSYDEALRHQALRRSSDFTAAEKLMTCPVLGSQHNTHLLTSSANDDVTVVTKFDAEASEAVQAGCRRPPPPYTLRPRRQNSGEVGVRSSPRSNGPVQRPVTGEDIIARRSDHSEGQQSRKNESKAVGVRGYNDKVDRISPGLRRTGSLPSPRRRRTADSAQKENIVSDVATTPTPSAPAPSAFTSKAAGGSRPAEFAVDAARKISRDSVSSKRLSLTTVRDRDWHRELADQYNSGSSSRNVANSLTAYI